MLINKVIGNVLKYDIKVVRTFDHKEMIRYDLIFYKIKFLNNKQGHKYDNDRMKNNIDKQSVW